MSDGVNTCIFIGNLGQDPETRYDTKGNAVTTISVGVNRSWTKDGEKQQRTEWVRAVAFNRLAEICGEYLKKGSKVYIMGEMRTRKWQDQNQQERYTTEIVLAEMRILDSRTSASQAAPPPQQQAPSGSNHGGKVAADFEDDSDRIPF